MIKRLMLVGLVGFLGFMTSDAVAQCQRSAVSSFQIQAPTFRQQFQIPVNVDFVPQVQIGGLQQVGGFGYGGNASFAVPGFGAQASFGGGFPGFVPGFQSGGFVQSNGGFVPFNPPQVIDTGIGARRDVLLGNLGGRVLIQRTGLLGRRRLILE